MVTLEQLNSLPRDEALEAFIRCCSSRRWAGEMVDARPFGSERNLFETAGAIWGGLEREDWMEAFSGHPRIGDVESLRKKYAATKAWASGEQSGVEGASEDVLKRLAAGNQAYEERFGYLFIVCATGKRADEMLALLEDRLHNDPAEEFLVAGAEQHKITCIRLRKLLGET